MVKNVLLIRASAINHDSLNYWTDRAEEQLVRRGVRVQIISRDGSAEQIGRRLLECLTTEHFDAVLAFNAVGLQDAVIDGENLWDRFQVPFYDYIVDHPLEHSEAIACSCQNFHLICVDQKHAAFAKRFYPSVRSADFLPLAGLGDTEAPPDDLERFVARKYGLTFTGGLMEPQFFKDRMARLPEKIRGIAARWTDYMEAHLDMAPEDALWVVLGDQFGGAPVPDEAYWKIADIASDAVLYIRTYIRKRIVEKLVESGLSLHIWGGGWDALYARCGGSGAVFHDDVPLAETPTIFRETKLALNVMPMFKRGTHDRIATAQIGGAAVLTDENEYLREFYAGTDGILYYRFTDIDALPGQIEALLADPEVLYQTAIKGQEMARSRLTWDAAGDRLIEILSGNGSFGTTE